jgi:hypothetical protein
VTIGSASAATWATALDAASAASTHPSKHAIMTGSERRGIVRQAVQRQSGA